ncbi:MAG: HlyC/CorC family transporter [Actinomycetota bacterium]|nr:MAG: HlyC/CorC family transporter [Actinomycetota bacterium]
MNEVLVSALLVLLFVLVGGFFAAAEIALVSLREAQVARLAETRGARGRRVGRLVSEPNRFLAAVQVGVTLAGFVSAGFGAAQIAPALTPALVGIGLSEGLASTVAFIAVTLVIAYVSLVLGELVPKRLALQRAETVALFVVGPVDWLARISRPFILLLSVSTNVVVRLFGGDPSAAKESISGEELRGMVAAHEDLSAEERELIDDVFAAGDRELREVMLPRTEVEFLDAATPVFAVARTVSGQPHSRYPVYRDSADDIVGFVHIRDVLSPGVVDRSIRVGELARDVLMLPGSKRVIPALTEMRRAGQHLAIVVDEYGGTAGIVTLEDLVEELVGDIRDEYDVADDHHSRRTLGGVIEVDGLLNLDDFADETGVVLPEGPYETVAGFAMASLGHLPAEGDVVDHDGYRLTITELDGRRVARVRVAPLP